MDRDYFKQNSGPQQGNIHHGSDKGQNKDEPAGSTINKSSKEQVAWEKNGETDKHYDTDEPATSRETETLGIP